MLGTSKIAPTQDDKETIEDFKKRETTQYNKQERVLTAILYRYGTTTINDIEKEVRKIGLPNNVEEEEVYADDGTLLRRITVYKVLKLLKARYTDGGLGIFTLVISKFYNLSLNDVKNAIEYSDKIMSVRYRLERIYKLLLLPELIIVLKFLNGLGNAFENFRTTFLQTYALLLTKQIGDRPARELVLLEETILQATNYEQAIKSTGIALTARIRIKEPLINETVLAIGKYTYYPTNNPEQRTTTIDQYIYY